MVIFARKFYSRYTPGGFTLVELMIVVAIIVILATIAIPNALRARMAANDVMAQGRLKTIATAFENYLVANGQYPDSTDDLTGATPAYLNRNYFSGTYSGFYFENDSGTYTYSVSAVPATIGSTGTTTYTITTGAVFGE